MCVKEVHGSAEHEREVHAAHPSCKRRTGPERQMNVAFHESSAMRRADDRGRPLLQLDLDIPG